jgi:hypothetical protein
VNLRKADQLLKVGQDGELPAEEAATVRAGGRRFLVSVEAAGDF